MISPTTLQRAAEKALRSPHTVVLEVQTSGLFIRGSRVVEGLPFHCTFLVNWRDLAGDPAVRTVERAIDAVTESLNRVTG